MQSPLKHPHVGFVHADHRDAPSGVIDGATIRINPTIRQFANPVLPIPRRPLVHAHLRRSLPARRTLSTQPVILLASRMRRTPRPQPKLTRPPIGGVPIQPQLIRSETDTAQHPEPLDQPSTELNPIRSRVLHAIHNPSNLGVLR